MDIWVVGEPDEDRGSSCVFLGAYATEQEAWAAIEGEDCRFLFPWGLGKSWDGSMPDHRGARWCPKMAEASRRRSEYEAERAALALAPRPPV